MALSELEELWRAPEWYRALSLTERGEPSAGMLTGASSDGESAERANLRLRAWKAQKPFDRGSLFAQRLAADSLAERDLLSLLAEPAAELRGRVPEVPHWMDHLRCAFMNEDHVESLRPLLDEVEIDHPLAGFLPALGPLLRHALGLLRRRVRALREQQHVLPFDAGLVPRAFLADIAPSLLFQVSKPLVLELHIARLQGRLHGETPEARFNDFIRQTCQEEAAVSLLAKYPVLARQLEIAIEQSRDYLIEFLAHLCTDWEAIRATFGGGTDPGLLVEVDAQQGDRHRRGRSVLVLRFESGLRLLYKPKPLAVDVHFQELLSWLNEHGVEPPLRTLTLIDRGDYGWSEFVVAAPCAAEEEVTRFYQRQGSYLALLYALNATDVHNENLIAAGEHPVLVDLEALFHPQVGGSDPSMTDLAAAALERSVWQVGLLPHRVWSDEESLGVDVSGLGGQSGQMNPHRLLSWDKPGTDEMRVGRQRVELEVSANRPRLDGRDVDVVGYRDAIVSGFTSTYRLLSRHRHELLAERLPRFAHDEIRAFARSTNVYGLLLYESFHPDLLRDALERDRFFDRLWLDAAQSSYLARVISAERRDLLRGDIPLFTTFPDSRAILTSEGELIDDFFDTPSLDLVRRRVGQLGEDDLVKQIWIVESSLATLRMNNEGIIGVSRPLPTSTRSVDRDQLLALANSVGERLDELALQNDTHAYWFGLGPLDDSAWGLFPASTDLYSGTTGITLFLAYLGAITGESAHAALARRALASVRSQVSAWLKEQEHLEANSAPLVGGFVGLPSVIYLLTHLADLWGEPELLDEAEGLVEKLPPLISADTYLDVLSGSAGCILSLLGLDAVRPSAPAVRAAVLAGRRVVSTRRTMARGVGWRTLKDQPALGGFSHGAAGFAHSLSRLAERTGDDQFRDVACEALDYDRSLFLPELDNWADLRVFSSRTSDHEHDTAADELPRTAQIAWCHGAPGIGLARLGTLDLLDDRRTRDEVDTALSSTREHGIAMNHSLCHGALGNVETLLTAARLINRPADRDALGRATAEVVGSIEADGPVTGVPLGVETPGLMTGLAGIGYELLRLAEPDKVPCVLLLAPPPGRTRF